MKRPKAATIYLSILVTLLPLLIVPGIDEFTLLPRLALFLSLTLVFSLYVLFYSEGMRLLPSGITLSILSFWAILAASALWAPNPVRSTFDLAKHVPAFVMCLLLARSLCKDSILTVATCHAAVGLLVSVIGIAEYFDAFPFSIPSTGRPSATFAYRNLAAAYLATGAPIAFLAYFLGKAKWQRYLGLAAGGAMILFLIYTRARASWVGLAAGVTFSGLAWAWLVFQKKSSIRAGIISIIRSPVTLSILIAVGLGVLPDRLTEAHNQRFDEKKESFAAALASITSPDGDRGRFGMWASTIDQIADYPIIGVGLGNWEYIYPLYDDASHSFLGGQIRTTSSPHRPHNDLLWIWSETGSVGLLIYIGLLIRIFQVCLRALATGTQDDRSTVLASMVTMVAFLGIGMFSFPFERVPPEFHFWLGASFVFICSPRPVTRSTLHLRTLTYILLPLVLLGALLITIRHIQFDRHYINAHIAYLKRDFGESARSAELALQHGSFEHQAYMMVGEGGYQRGDWEAAETGYRNTLRYHPNFANAHNGLGLVDIGRGNHPAALEHFNNVTEIIVGHHVAIFNKGICFESLGQTDSAIAQYRKAYQDYYTTPYVNLGAIYRKQNKVDSAIAVYTTAAHGTVPAPEAWFNLGNIYSEKKEFTSSGHAYVEFLKLWSKEDSVWAAARKGLSQSYSGYGVQLEQRGEVDSAKAAYERSLDINPNEPVNWFNLGNILRAKSQFDDAAGAYEKAITLDPQHLDSHNNLGMTYRDLGDDEEAIEIYRKAKAFAPNNAILNFNLGQALLVVGKSAEANEQFETFRKNWKGDASLVHYHLGNAYYQSGLLLKADTEYSAFLLNWRGDKGIRRSVEGFLKSIRSAGAQ